MEDCCICFDSRGILKDCDIRSRNLVDRWGLVDCMLFNRDLEKMSTLVDQSRAHKLGSVGLDNLLVMAESRKGLRRVNNFEVRQLRVKE